jgi:dTDP-4-dehydrorhamnose reductase
MKVLVLGHKGMLGHMVSKLLSTKGIEVFNTECRWSTSCFKNIIKKFEGDYIINCIGAIPQKTNYFNINWKLPQWLDENANCKIIHPGTDCEMDDDDYGNSKRKISEWIKSSSKNTKIIKTSILGPELNSKVSLMEWFLSQTGEINGYSECYWNGNTTLTWAKFCLYLMENWDNEDIETILEGECISKYNLLLMLQEIYQRPDIIINPINEPVMDKCLKGKVKTPRLLDQLMDMKYFCDIQF